MHLELNYRIKLLSVILGTALLTSCASTPYIEPADIESRDVIVGQPTSTPTQDELITPQENRFDDQALQAEELNVNRAQYYRQQSQNQNNKSDQIDSTLSAAEYYIQAQDFQGAEQSVASLYIDPLNEVQADRLTIINAYVAYAKGQHQQSLSLLEPLWSRQAPLPELEIEDELPIIEAITNEVDEQPIPILATIPEQIKLSTQQVDALLLGSFNYQALNDYDSAINALIKREGSLVGKTRSETTRYIWQVIATLTGERRQQILNNTQNLLVRNRVEQSLNSQSASIATAPQQFEQWREDANSEVKPITADTWGPESPRSIAVLLPITSKFNKAAQAVKDGINYQHSTNQSPFRPELRFYDIGDSPYNATQYYAAALQSGADFVIGPLGKDYANQVNSYRGSDYGRQQVPTLLLGGDTAVTGAVSRFSMSPEMEGARVAERAWKDGHLSAGLLITDSASNRRVADSFIKKWRNLGGKISNMVTYSPKQYDHSVELKQLFNINQSQYRHNQLSTTLGFKPKFSAYQRSDIDFILMLANTQTGRLIRPQVNFFSGSNIPVYSTSSIFNGFQDAVNNIDLDGTRFPIMPWVLRSTKVAPYAGQLNMLFALGTDAYRIVPSYSELRRNDNLAINGNTGQVSISNYGEAIFQPIWARFKNGEVIPMETLGLDTQPIDTLNSEGFTDQRVNGTYNDSTYNSQTWDRQSGNRRETQKQQSDDQRQDLEDGLRGSR